MGMAAVYALASARLAATREAAVAMRGHCPKVVPNQALVALDWLTLPSLGWPMNTTQLRTLACSALLGCALALSFAAWSQETKPPLKDGEICDTSSTSKSTCQCGFVVCAKGCKCQMTGPTGICVDCPIPTVPTGAANTGSLSVWWPWWLVGGLVVVGALIWILRRNRNS